jgi:hypothetical protein
MRVGALPAELANLTLLPELAFLSLEVVVRDLQHLVLYFRRQDLQALVSLCLLTSSSVRSSASLCAKWQ